MSLQDTKQTRSFKELHNVPNHPVNVVRKKQNKTANGGVVGNSKDNLAVDSFIAVGSWFAI